MNKNSIAVILVNVGTPEKSEVKYVRRYLREFLMDPRVIDIPYAFRWMLVNLIIAPFRAFKSTKLYKSLWTDAGSPLLIYGEKARNLLQKELGINYTVHLAMRYQAPNLSDVLTLMKKSSPKKIIIFPLFPQYASATSGSVFEYSMRILSKWQAIPRLSFIHQFYHHPLFVEAFVQRIREYNPKDFDHILMSYHGLPLRQLTKAHSGKTCEELNCVQEVGEESGYCYQAACYETSRLIAAKLGLSTDQYTVTFQSRLSKNWMSPFTDEKIIELAKQGKKKLLIASPAFVADCLETLIEIGEEYRLLFSANGGEKLTLVESLNDHPVWIHTMATLVREK